MAALFRPWVNTATHIVLILAPALGIVALTMPILYARTPFATGEDEPVLQPIAFDHRHHVGDLGIDCRYCHDGVERSPRAGVPPTERCLGCHAQIWNDSPAIAPLVASAASGQPIRWRAVDALPDFVYFDHGAHVAGGIGCVTCHGRVERMAAVYPVHAMTMDWCLGCHRDPTPALRPRERITDPDWSAPPGEVARLARTYRTRRLTHCSTCHR
jgi:hypothetical protein